MAAVEDAISKPDADARTVAVKLDEEGIRMSKDLEAGKTAFTVTNVGKEKHNFEIEGPNLEKSFWLSVAPNDTKIMQGRLETGNLRRGLSAQGTPRQGIEAEGHGR